MLANVEERFPISLLVRTHTPTSADAVFIGGNGFRAIGIIKALEEELGLPVLTANRVAFWHAQRLAGSRASGCRFGRIFAVTR